MATQNSQSGYTSEYMARDPMGPPLGPGAGWGMKQYTSYREFPHIQRQEKIQQKQFEDELGLKRTIADREYWNQVNQYNLQKDAAKLRENSLNALLNGFGLGPGSTSSGVATGNAFLGGPPQGFPEVRTDPIFGEADIQKMANSARARSTAGSLAAINDVKSSFGGRGFSADSPISQALATRTAAAGRAQGEDSALSATIEAKKSNADHKYRTEAANASNAANIYGSQQGTRNALVAALASLGR